MKSLFKPKTQIRSVDSILAPLNDAIVALVQTADDCNRRHADISHEISGLMAEQDAVKVEAKRAVGIVEKLKELVA